MTLQELLTQFAESISYYNADRLHDCFIDLTLQQHKMDETTEEYMILTEKIEIAREMLLDQRHREQRRGGW